LYRLGHFSLDPEKRLLLAQDRPVHLSRKPYDVLLYLIANRQRMVSRAELLERFWGGQDVYDQTLSKAVGAIRKALGETGEGGLFIETRWAAGYRYIGPFELIRPIDEVPAAKQHEQVSPEAVGTSEGATPTTFPSSAKPALPEPEARAASASLTPGPGAWLTWKSARQVAVLVLLVLCVSGLAVWGRRSLNGAGANSSAAARIAQTPVRPSVAVFAFKNLSPRADQEWLGPALAEMLSTELGADARLRALPGESIARATKELQLTRQSGFAPETLASVRQNLAADYVVTGAYAVVNAAPGSAAHAAASHQLRLDICVQDTKSGETVATFANSADVQQLFAVVTSSGTQMLAALRLPAITPSTEKLARAALPANPAATRLYMEGLQQLRQQDLQNARDTLAKSVQADPAFPLAHLALADAWERLGYLQNEKAEASRAYELSTHLGRELQLYVQALYLTTALDWDKAIASWHTLADLYPDNIEYGLQLASAQLAADKPQEAQATIATLRKIASPAAEDPRLDMADAAALRATSALQDSAEAAARAAAKARAQHAPLLYARALTLQAAAVTDSDTQQAARLSAEARDICRQFQDLGCLSTALRRLGNLEIDSDPEAAEADLHEALRLARQLGNFIEEGNALNSIAVLLSNHGRLREARAVYQELLEHNSADRSAWGTQMLLNNLGSLEIRQGQLAEALHNEESALRIARQIGLKLGAGDELLDLAQIQELQGDLAAAQSSDEEALAIFTEIKSTEGRALAHLGLGDISRDRGDLSAAGQQFQQCIDLLTAAGDSSELALARLAMARLQEDEGHAQESASLATSAAENFHKLGRPAEEASARAVLATALAERGDAAAARLQVEQSLRLIAGSESVLDQMQVAIAAARANALTSASVNSAEALAAERQLRGVSGRAKNAKILSLELQAELAAAEVQARAGHPVAGRPSLEELQRTANRSGFALIARQAGALRAPYAAQVHAARSGLR
jgi:DNA-binding winged helix-turn-helix (wHTH) protein/tetratricopeptide (TPR) repeat protein